MPNELLFIVFFENLLHCIVIIHKKYTLLHYPKHNYYILYQIS